MWATRIGSSRPILPVWFLVVSVITVGFGPPAVAQEPEPAAEQFQQEVDQEAPGPTFEKEITITGSLIPRPNLDSLSPVTVVDVAEELTLTGTTRVEDLLISLPQVFAGQNSTISNGQQAQRQSICDISVKVAR